MLRRVVCTASSGSATGVADSIVRRVDLVLGYSDHTGYRARPRESTRSLCHFHCQNEQVQVVRNGTREAGVAPSLVLVTRNVFAVTTLRRMQTRAVHTDVVLVGAQLTDGCGVALVVLSAGASDEANGDLCGPEAVQRSTISLRAAPDVRTVIKEQVHPLALH